MQITIGDFTRTRLVASKVTPSRSGADLLKHISRGVSKIADESIREWQQAKISQAGIAGKAAGYQENVTYQSGDSLTAQAFNKAAAKSVATATQIQTTLGMNEIQQTYANDPNEYQIKSDAFIEEQTLGLKEHSQTAGLADIMEGQMRLAQQTAGYQISKKYMAQQVSKMKADTAILTHTIKAEAYRTAGGVFSTDENEQGIALNNFARSKQLLDASLHAVLPDGTPAYSAEAIQLRQQAFHTDFYTTAVQSWVSEANLSVKDLADIRKGTLKIKVPGVGEIDILSEVGKDAYESKIKAYATQKMRDKIMIDKKIEAQEKLDHKEDMDVADVEMISSIYDGGAIDSSTVLNMLRDGKISKIAANSAIKMLQNPAAEIDDDKLFTTLKIQQIQGNLETTEIPQYAANLSVDSYRKLMEAGVKQDKTMQSEDEKWIVREMVKKDRFGMDDPKSVRLAADMVDMYRATIKDGTGPELAMEKARTAIDVLKDRVNREMFNSVPKYSVIENNTINTMATTQATLQAFEHGKITEEVYDIEMGRLEALINEKRRGRSE